MAKFYIALCAKHNHKKKFSLLSFVSLTKIRFDQKSPVHSILVLGEYSEHYGQTQDKQKPVLCLLQDFFCTGIYPSAICFIIRQCNDKAIRLGLIVSGPCLDGKASCRQLRIVLHHRSILHHRHHLS